ncbi:MAG: transporter [Frankiales bacterium]|nr:transporter [Frankiales bacterium]
MTRSRPLVPVLVFLGMVVAVVSSLGAPLVPTIAADTHVSLATAQWSLTISLLVGAVATPTMGRLGDGPHRRTVVLVAIATVVIGCVLAALPLSFPYLLVGRALMGTGLGLTPIAMATARDALTGERSRSAVAVLSITTVAGIGLGYPLTGLITQHLSFRAGFWFGAIITGIAFLAALVVFPSTRERPYVRLDVLGAALLGTGVAGLLLALSEAETWSGARLLTVTVLSALLLLWWVRQELRTAHPLVDLRLARNRSVLTADATGLFAGIGMYMLISLVIRFVQTPARVGYGFGASVVMAGLVLLPFSLMSVVSSRVAPAISRRVSPHAVLPLGCAISLAAELLFALERGHLWQVFVIMGIAGLGVGCTFAALPGLIVRAVPASETGSAMSFNQVLRYVGYSTGSALSATILEAHTRSGQQLPTGSGYTTAALVGCGVLAVAGLLSAALPQRGKEEIDELLAEESIADGIPSEEPRPVGVD